MLVENYLMPWLQNHNNHTTVFQQEGLSPHFTREVYAYFDSFLAMGLECRT